MASNSSQCYRPPGCATPILIQDYRNFVFHQLPGGQPAPLVEGPRLTCVDPDILPLLCGRPDHTQGRTPAHTGQPAGVAVGQYHVTVFQELGASGLITIRSILWREEGASACLRPPAAGCAGRRATAPRSLRTAGLRAASGAMMIRIII